MAGDSRGPTGTDPPALNEADRMHRALTVALALAVVAGAVLVQPPATRGVLEEGQETRLEFSDGECVSPAPGWIRDHDGDEVDGPWRELTAGSPWLVQDSGGLCWTNNNGYPVDFGLNLEGVWAATGGTAVGGGQLRLAGMSVHPGINGFQCNNNVGNRTLHLIFYDTAGAALNGSIVTTAPYNWTPGQPHDCSGASSPTPFDVTVTVPAAATRFRMWSSTDGGSWHAIGLQEFTVVYAEPGTDPTLPGECDPESDPECEEGLPALPEAPAIDPAPAPPDAAAYLGSCVAPDGIEVWEWAAYIGCLAWQGLQLAVAYVAWTGGMGVWAVGVIAAYVPWFVAFAIATVTRIAIVLIRLGPAGILGIGLDVLGHLSALPSTIYDAFAEVIGLPSTQELFAATTAAVQEIIPFLEGLELNPLIWAQNIGAAIEDAIGGLLEALFVPGPAVGQAWDDLMTMLNGKAPIGWVAQVVSYLYGSLTAGNLAGPALTTFGFTILDAPIVFNPAPLVTVLDDYRPVLAGLIYLSCAWVIFHRIGGTLRGSEA